MDYSGIIEDLKNLDFMNNWSSFTNLSAIAGVLYHPDNGWTPSACEALREKLATMATDAMAYDDMEAHVERLNEAAANHEDITVNGVEYMPYPFDSDGMQLHIGDEVSWTGFPDEHGEVKSLYVDADGTWSASVEASGSVRVHYYAGNLHHRSRKSVEDVLTELLDMVTGSDGNYGDIVESYAKLLRLAEVDNEQ